MGLDQYMYVAQTAGADWEDQSRREIGYRRKHPNLHGWMRKLWESRGNTGDFNGDELELTWTDLERLELDNIAGSLPGTSGFFFGNDADDHYREQDLKFVRDARAELFCGFKVFYNSSW